MATTKNTPEAAEDDLDTQPFADISDAPYPTKKTLRHRKSLIPQFFKFMAFNLSIMRMVTKGHKHSK